MALRYPEPNIAQIELAIRGGSHGNTPANIEAGAVAIQTRWRIVDTNVTRRGEIITLTLSDAIRNLKVT